MRRSLLVLAALVAAPVAVSAADPLPPDLALVPRGAVWVAHVRVGDVRKDPASVLARANVLRAIPKAFAGMDGQFAPKPSTFDRVTGFSLTVPNPPGVPSEPKAATATAKSSDPPLTPAADPPVVSVVPPKTADDAGIILRCSAPFDRKAVLAGFSKDPKPDPDAAKAGKEVHAEPTGAYALAFVDDVTLVLGTKKAVLAVVAPGPAEQKGEHPLAEALAEAAKPAHALTVGLADSKLFVGAVPPDDTLKDVRTAVAFVDLGADPVISGRVRFADAAAAQKAVAQVLSAGKEAKQFLADRKVQAQKQLAGDPAAPGPRPLADLPTALDGLGTVAGIEWLESIAATPPLVIDNDTVSFQFVVHPLFARFIAPLISWSALSAPGTAIGGRPEGFGGILFPPGGLVGPATTQNNLKLLAIGMHNMHDVFGKFPTTTGTDKPDKPLLSWRVAVLPYIDHEPLYKKFKLDEPWDSAHNKKALADNPMPKEFALPGITQPADKVTHYQAFVGNGALFDRAKGAKIPDVIDGTSNTVMLGIAKTAVEWTRPDDIAFDPKGDPTKLLATLDRTGQFTQTGVFWVALADGSVRSLKSTIKPATLRGLITRAGGELVNPDE